MRAIILPFLVSCPVLSQSPLRGEKSAVYDLLDRVLPVGGRDHFRLSLIPGEDCGVTEDGVTVHPPCFRLGDNVNGKLVVAATSASELSAGIGWYLRHYCNMTIGWPRGGGLRVFVPPKWPQIGPNSLFKQRVVPWSYLMNVCTHSYSLVWYDWNDWERFIDWMSLSGINNMLAMTGQEEVQYKVFRKLGLRDEDIRSWFNGPAFLTWSRGQNEYGNNICGPLPRSWMKAQWSMQKHKILPRLRSLGITGQLPAFQGNVPIQLKALFNDTNITQQGDTGWMDSLDPLFGKIADLWMVTLLEDFGTDHWYQLDGYFNGGTAPWALLSPPQGLRAAVTPEDAYAMAFRRGSAAYAGLVRTDPNAVWSYQGWAFIGGHTRVKAAQVKGFVDSAPHGKFVIIDMSGNGDGEWKYWNNSAFFGASFVWTSLNNFGGTDGMKGNLTHVNQIPFDALSSATSIVGIGATPEGIDQNPAYYDFLFEHSFRDQPVTDVGQHMVRRAHTRYGLREHSAEVGEAWSLLVDSAYSRDGSTTDHTGIPHLPPSRLDDESAMFETDRHTPKPILCKIFAAWGHMIHAAETAPSSQSGFRDEPFVYDLVNLGREVLAQLATPASLNFSDATHRPTLDKDEIATTGQFYVNLLNDVDDLVATDGAFLLGPWLDLARRWGDGADRDCTSSILKDDGNCPHFYEWNARTQLTTWNPTPEGAPSIPGGPVDYAGKHWSGLIRDYYVVRATLLLRQALKDADSGGKLNGTEVSRLYAAHAYEWTTAENRYATSPVGNALAVSRCMHEKYKDWFASCGDGMTSIVGASDVVE